LDEEVVFKIQIASSKNKIQLKSYNFKGLKNVQRVKVGSYYKYYYGVTTNYIKVKNSLLKAKSKGYSDALIAAFKKGKKSISYWGFEIVLFPVISQKIVVLL